MRTIKELLELLLEEFELHIEIVNGKEVLKNWENKYGLCYVIDCMKEDEIISLDECIELSNYIYVSRPRLSSRSLWGWRPGIVISRRKWIKKHIKINN